MPRLIQIYSTIGLASEGGYSQDQFQADLAAAVSSGESQVQLRINSVGGNWLMAQGMYGMIKASALKIDTYCDGIAASSASLLFMAGKKRLIAAHARLMIHNCSGPAAGQVADLQRAIEGQNAINESMATVYATTSGQPIEKIREMMAAETWLSADEAVTMGFATGKIDAPKAATPPPADLTSSTAQDSLLQLQAYYAGHLPPASPTSTMKNLLLPILQAHAVANITAQSSDEQVTSAVTAAFTELGTTRLQVSTLTASVQSVTAEKQALETELNSFKEKAAADEKAAGEKAVNDLVANALATGKITASLVPQYTALATASLSAATAVLDSLPAKQSVITKLTASAGGQGAAQVGSVSAAGYMAEISARTAKA
jgi:ATP-dependent protease ClpP protease subunit